jgi:uncharacterized protein (DUF58 family)
VTGFGYSAAPLGVLLVVLGLAARWPPMAVLGAGILLLFGGSALFVWRRPRLRVERAVEPPRVEKGRPAIALIHCVNLARRAMPATVIEQRLGDRPIRAVLPRLRRGETSLRTYRLPTTDRGLFEIGPVEIPRADPFGFCRTVQRLGQPQQIAVHPRLLHLSPLPTGVSRNLEGPSSDSSPQGSVTFHRLREYVVGDDLRLVHWPSTARLGRLVVRHNVDTAQPYTVVLLDLDPQRYSAETFEEAVDTAASVAVSMSSGRAPVQLRTTGGDRVGGPTYRDPVAIVDFLTGVAPRPGALDAELVLLRRDRGGTALVVVTGLMDPASLPTAAALRRRFDRVIVMSLAPRPSPAPLYPGVVLVEASSASEAARAWNTVVAR